MQRESHLSNDSRAGWTNIRSGGKASGTTTETRNVIAGCMDSVEIYFRARSPGRGSRNVCHAFDSHKLGYSGLE